MAEAAPGTPERHTTRGGARIYRLALRLFPGLDGYAHLILSGDLAVLVDVGSGFGNSNDDLEAGLAAVREQFGEQVGWDSLTHVLLTHGHIDHFGGLPYVRPRTQALIGVHELDRPVVMYHDERLAVVAHRLGRFLVEAGVEAEARRRLMDLYLFSKHLYTSQPVDFTFEATGMRLDDLELIHVPGHCPGQVVIRLDDVLLSGDHILPGISPHQSPEVLTLYTGLGHYLESLRRLKPLADAIRVTLGGHGEAIDDLDARLAALEAFHRDRLELILRRLDQPMTMAELSDRLFPAASGYHALLALEETGAHVEYLLQRGAIGCVNPEALESFADEPLRYIRRGTIGMPLAQRPPGVAAAAGSAQPPTHGTSREERFHVRL